MSKQSINIGTNPNDGTGDTLRAAMDKVNDNTNEVYSLFGNGTTLAISGDATVSAGALTIANDAVGYDKLGAEFTTSGANTTLTFSNVSTGMVVDLVITGNYTLTLPTSVKEISGTYDGTVSNLIQIVSTNGSTEQWATISQEA
jgi:hypothetical protein